MAIIDLDIVDDHERFRSELASIAPDGRRRWIFARKPSGKYYRWRSIIAALLLSFLFLAPHIKVNGHQFILLNIIKREFVLFGVPFWPNDSYLILLIFLTVLISFVVFTAILGRLWCGWLCPQTIFMEMVFRRIEWWIDGGPKEQALRKAGPWTWDRLWRASLKVTVFFAISFAIANTFLAYVVSTDALLLYISDGPVAHLSLFIPLLIFSVVFFAVFYRFREQACLIACPYGRYMSALVDQNTVAVTYDFKRGEHRAKWTKEDNDAKQRCQEQGTSVERPNGHGDCVDCHQCVTVCPTGIDIRNGIQLECVNCTACIDACDEVMNKVGLPRGLVRYTSATMVLQGAATWLTPRIKAYIVVWLLMVSTVVGLYIHRSTLDVQIVRQSGSLWVNTTGGVANFYTIQVINKTDERHTVSVDVVSPKGATVQLLGAIQSVAPHAIVKGRLYIIVPDSLRRSETSTVALVVHSGSAEILSTTVSFVAPQKD